MKIANKLNCLVIFLFSMCLAEPVFSQAPKVVERVRAKKEGSEFRIPVKGSSPHKIFDNQKEVPTSDFKNGTLLIPANHLNRVLKLTAANNVSYQLFADSKSPQLVDIKAIPFPGAGGQVKLKFADADWEASKTIPPGSGGVFTFTRDKEILVPDGPPHADKADKSLTFRFKELNSGKHVVSIVGLTDSVGNGGTKSLIGSFTVSRSRLLGEHREYPATLAPEDKVISARPAHRVDTRDVRLYYFRDAHRVAQIINRNVRSLNQESFDQAARLAEKAQLDAEEATEQRKKQELAAVKAAADVRALERSKSLRADFQRRKDDATRTISAIQDQINSIANPLTFPELESDGNLNPAAVEFKVVDEFNKLNPQTSTAAVRDSSANAQDVITTTESQGAKTITKITGGGNAAGSTVTAENQLAEVRALASNRLSWLQKLAGIIQEESSDPRLISDSDIQSKLTAADTAQQNLLLAQQKEDRARREQFQREVAAGISERDTYVPGKLSSIDPVTQVSISVIGEGVLQLRGPIKGINQIRRMVHQIDSPVGQVKIGIHTIQINGEHGDRMERVAEDIEKHIARSRFLTNQSGLLVRKAVAIVASQVAESAVNGGQCNFMNQPVDMSHIPPGVSNQHDLKYMYSFFGADLIRELQKMNSELLDSNNKLISLNSMDTLSFVGALYVTALANNDVRQQILHEFKNMLECELPEKEVNYYRTLTRTRHRHKFLNKLVTSRLQTKLDNRDAEKIRFNAHRNYTFSNTIGFFDSTLQGRGTLNNMQHAVLRLAQTLKAHSITEAELKTLTAQKALLFEGDQVSLESRLLGQALDELEEKSVELLEALRANSSKVDNFLKRLAIALEDDVNAQFYDPAFQEIRRVSRTWDVQLGQIEKTTVLTNNRKLAKVNPSATIEFDLPRRELFVTEAINGFRAIADEHGNLLKDPTFLAGTALLAGQPAAGVVGSQSPMQAIPGVSLSEPFQTVRPFGAELEKLVPDPAVYKFETGTAYEIRPVIQPDGHSIVYDFNYMYTTNVREPIRADEKHLGRVKRHYVHTDVQTSCLELREVSRYTVALKAARTSRGVPLMEDVPVVGALFRPLPSDESSLQQNIILASSVIYPTLYDLMGLRWSAHLNDLDSPTLVSRQAKLEQKIGSVDGHLREHITNRLNQKLFESRTKWSKRNWSGGKSQASAANTTDAGRLITQDKLNAQLANQAQQTQETLNSLQALQEAAQQQALQLQRHYEAKAQLDANYSHVPSEEFEFEGFGMTPVFENTDSMPQEWLTQPVPVTNDAIPRPIYGGEFSDEIVVPQSESNGVRQKVNPTSNANTPIQSSHIPNGIPGRMSQIPASSRTSQVSHAHYPGGARSILPSQVNYDASGKGRIRRASFTSQSPIRHESAKANFPHLARDTSDSSVFELDSGLLLAYGLSWLICGFLAVKHRAFGAATFVAIATIGGLAGFELLSLHSDTWQVSVAFVTIPIGVFFSKTNLQQANC